MTDKKLQEIMTNLYNQLEKSENKVTDKQIIAKAVQLGMKYQEEKIKQGIEIVFSELNHK